MTRAFARRASLVAIAIVSAGACDRFLQFQMVHPADAPPVDVLAVDVLPPPDLCLVDKFEGSAIDVSMWTPYAGSGASVAESNGQFVVTLPSNAKAYAGISLLPRALLGITTSAEIVTVPTGAVGATMEVKWSASGSDDYILYREGGTLAVIRHNAGVRTVVGTTFFNATSHRFWRIRHDAGSNVLWFEVGSDGVTWPTTVASEQPQISLANTIASLACGTYTAQSSPGMCVYDNFVMTGCAP
jgi:hypothetical protein